MIPLIKTVHTAATLALALARQQRFFDRQHPPVMPLSITAAELRGLLKARDRLRMAKATLPSLDPALSPEQMLAIVHLQQQRIAAIRRLTDRHKARGRELRLCWEATV